MFYIIAQTNSFRVAKNNKVCFSFWYSLLLIRNVNVQGYYKMRIKIHYIGFKLAKYIQIIFALNVTKTNNELVLYNFYIDLRDL